MSFASAIHDPLALNLSRQKALLLSYIPPQTFHYNAIKQSNTTRQLLSTLSTLLAIPAFTKIIATLFRPILTDLCARWLEVDADVEQHLVALCYLVEVHEELFSILHELLVRSYQNGPLSIINESLSPQSINNKRLQQLILAYYRLLQANRELPEQLSWPLAPLSTLIWTPHLDNGVRLLAIRCYSLQSGMGEKERCSMEREVLGELCGVDCPLNYGQNLDGSEKEVDGWILPVIEMRRVQEERDEVVTEPMDYFSAEDMYDENFSLSKDLSPRIVNVHGVLLLRTSTTSSIESPLIPLPSTIESLRNIALHVSLRLPTLLTSSPSAGKALLLSHLAKLLHPQSRNQIVTIHLADTSLDPRALLGSYMSSSTSPGTFEWKEGVLVRSMREGKWVVFEDIDRGSNEVLGVIKPLVESLTLGKWIGGRAHLEVPSRGKVVAHAHFMLFATRSLLPSRKGEFSSPVFFGAHKFSEVTVKSLSIDELRTIVTTQYPRFGGEVAAAIINLWDSAKKLGSHSSGRDIGLRELQKFCQRLDRIIPSSLHSMDISSGDTHVPTFAQIFPNPSIREDMYIEARDVFFGAGTMSASSRAHAETVARVIGDYLNLEADRQQWVLKGKTPELTLEKDSNGNTTALQCGRAHLPALSAKQGLPPSPSRPFVLHKPALSLISRIANAVSHNEPILLTGETGTGKTSVISHLASLLHRPLISLNLSHQTESSDLIGGLKPIDARIPGSALQERFLGLFGSTFSRRKNEKFETEVRKAVNECKWKRVVGLWKESVRLAMERIRAKEDSNVPEHTSEAPRKRRKTERSDSKSSEYSWSAFLRDIEEFEVQHVQGKGKFAFGFVEGPLVKALRSGDWVLLDEVNLASPETLECISGLLHGPTASITLTEHGSLEPVPRHPDFRLFACMNPATDVGKKDLPPTIRSRFTEMDVPPPDADKDTLLSIISQYVGHIAVGDKRIIMDIAEFYSAVKQVAESRQIADGANHRPHFSMRTLVRALTFAADTASTYSLRRSVWEGCLMAFTMVLDGESAKIVTSLAQKHLLSGVKNPRSILTKEPPMPASGDYVKFGPFFLEKGPLESEMGEDYIITPSVEDKLVHLSRIVLTRRFPVLIEGPTSSGKTSSIEYLAKRTGHRFVRINNHEHTDIQEYLGSYVSDPITGKLVFKDGLLVQALRQGHWIVLDELNLAPTDVLEALNRLLDDNRELVIPETQEVVRPHPHFMLFATQNPPGLYAGRKILSRAFRNRFLEVHFEDVPQVELETILCRRCQIAPSYGKKIVTVFRELQKRRQTSRVFESKQGFATLRDLFRWAGRDAVGYQELADNGYMLLAERSRRPEDKMVVKEVIETVMGVRIDEDSIYNLFRSDMDMSAYLGHPVPDQSSVIWTKAMQRLYILVCRGLKFNEPILLVGETGSGKTSVCQVFADASSQQLVGLNCHQNTETADIIGGLRPVRNRSSLQADVVQESFRALHEAGVEVVDPTPDSLTKVLTSTLQNNRELDETSTERLTAQLRQLQRLNSIFEWHDGPLIEAMHKGDVFLLDEISLADDSVLERLNSVLEPSRSIVLAERSGTNSEQAVIHASGDFKLLATMNPGGDYGKKELSPALRNRFTEIWVPSIDDRHDLELIVGNLWQHRSLQVYTPHVLDFVEWLCKSVGDRTLLTLRDILAWVNFTNSAYRDGETGAITGDELFHHAAHMCYLDGLSSLPQLSGYSREALSRLKADAVNKLQELVPITGPLGDAVPVHDSEAAVQLGYFAIPKGGNTPIKQSFNFNSPTTLNNAMRVVRACQVEKPILLEGSPGVGKTSLITALANLAGHILCRINLSDQTDLIDLLGSDLPVEGGSAGEFAWKDAEFLRALQEGHWVLLDEMNLAPQAVLEGLNAILDHRGSVYIPELNRSFRRHPSFRIFAAQNPLHQGGGRKGLPKSFVNRFTKVYVEELEPRDLYTVCSHIFPTIDETTLRAMISFNLQLNQEITIQRSFAQAGFPWEFNLRDIIRWATLSSSTTCPEPSMFLKSIYLHRFRSLQDRSCAKKIFESAFCSRSCDIERTPTWTITDSEIQFGHFTWTRQNYAPLSPPRRVLKMQLSALESLGDCISQSWLAILTGPKISGKTNIVRTLANASGNVLWEVSVNSSTDTMDILGSFEQVDTRRRLLALIDDMVELLKQDIRTIQGSRTSPNYRSQLSMLRDSCEQGSLHDLPMVADKVAALAYLLQESRSNTATYYGEVCSELKCIASSNSDVGQFEWVDGPLIRAMKTGHWLLLDGANLCGPSVLDRLNSLCESDGSLTLSERGFVHGNVQCLKPHPNFRLFMSVDPHYGELSRAMRNRGIEIALISGPLADDHVLMQAHYRLPQSMSPCSAGPHAQSIIYEAARRGLLSNIVPKESSMPSTGRCFDQDSALSNLVDGAPSLIPRSVASDELPWIFFLSRSLTPRYMPYLTRYLENFTLPKGVRELIDRFLHQDSAVALQIYRDIYGKATKLSDTFLLSQPMDFYWVADMASVSPQRSLVFELINLGASLFICERNGPPNIDEKLAYNEKTLHAHRIVVNIHREMLQIGRNLLKSATCEELDHVRLASKTLHFSIYLKTALSSQPYNFSDMYSISKALLDDLDNCPTSFHGLYEQSKTLHDIATLSTGLGLFAIWSNMYINALPQDLHDVLTQTEKQVASINIGVDNSAIRRQAFNVMSLETLPSPPESQKYLLADLRSKLNDCLKNISVTTISEGMSYRNQASVLLELYTLVSCVGQYHDQFLSDVMQEIINMACLNSNTSLLHLVSYQHLLWTSEVGPGSPGVVANAQLSWFEGLWNANPETSKLMGPSILLHPVFLPRVITACDMDQTSLLSLAQQSNVLRQEARLVILQSRQTTDRFTQLAQLFFQTLSIIMSCFSAREDTSTCNSLKKLPIGEESDFSSTFSHGLTLMQNGTDENLVSSAVREFGPLILIMRDLTQSQSMGIAWIGLGRLLLNLTVPDTPVDPAAVQASNYKRMEHVRSNLDLQERLHRQLEILLTGNDNNDTIQFLDTHLSNITSQLGKIPALPSRDDVSRLHVFWSEVAQFMANVLPSSKVNTLVNGLIKGDQDVQLRERVMQESLVGFLQRLDRVYPDFADINIFLKLAIHYIRLGIRFILESGSLSNHKRAKWAGSLLAFPPASSASSIIDDFTNIGPSEDTACQHIVIALSSLSLEVSLGLQRDGRLPRFEMAYEQLFRLWSIDRTKEKQLTEDASTLYRRSKMDHTDISEAEIEEAEFLDMFPVFEASMEHGNKEHCAQSQSLHLVKPEDMITISYIHFDWLSDCKEKSTVTATNDFRRLRDRAIEKLVTEAPESLPATLEKDSFAFQLGLLREAISILEKKATSKEMAYNFYSDVNYKELKRGASVIIALRQRLAMISEEWPEQMVLKHLMERCDDILKISSKSPIARILSMLEQLLVQSEDWQMYANRENSIKNHQDELVHLIVDWRRLELSCWQGLLDSQAKTFTEEVSEWWFRLYEAVVRGPLNCVINYGGDGRVDGAQALDNYVDTLIPLLDSFITSSPLGQFDARMRLLDSFGTYVGRISASRPAMEKEALERVHRVIKSSYNYYDLFSDNVRKHLAGGKAPLEAQIRELIKLASWKDINVQALKQSAQRTHRQLYKIIKKFRDLLRQTVTDQLQSSSSEDYHQLAAPLDSSVLLTSVLVRSYKPIVSASILPMITSNHLLNLDVTYNKFLALIEDVLRPRIQTQSAQSIDDIAVEIIVTSNDLASSTVPSGLPNDLRVKHQKALLVRKRKALSDMLKELKHAGLASNLKPEVLSQNNSQRWIREQPAMPSLTPAGGNVDKGELYFVKLSGSLPVLRESIPAHHSDITTRELQRGQMFLESGVSLAISLRSQLTTALDTYLHLERSVQRILTLRSAGRSILPGINTQQHVSSLNDEYCKLVHALSEVHDNALVLNQLEPDLPVEENFLHEIASAINSIRNISVQLRQILDTFSNVSLSFLTPDENNFLLRAKLHLFETTRTITVWRDKQPGLNHLFSPLKKWLGLQEPVPLLPVGDPIPLDGVKVEALLNSILISIQALNSRTSEAVNHEVGNEEKYLIKGYQLCRDYTHRLNMNNIRNQLLELLGAISSPDDLRAVIDLILPFFELYLPLAKDQLTVHSDWTKSLFKLDYVLCSVLLTLSQQGFCRPPDEGQDDKNGGQSTDAGLGIGEGSGVDNVSKEIEDESQIEGLQGEGDDKQEPAGDHEDGDAIEMNDDFGGALEDVPDPGSDGENDNADSDSDNEQDIDETIGDLDELDPSAVDEKLWGDEKGPEDPESKEEKADQDHSKEQEGSSEVVAKESQEQKKSKEKSADKQPKGEEPDVEMSEDQHEVDESENDESDDPNVNGSKMDEHVPEANTLDLPEEMDLGEDGMENEAEGSKDDDADLELGDDENTVEDGQDNLDDFPQEDFNMDTAPPIEEPADNSKHEEEGESNLADSTQEKEKDGESEDNESPPEEIMARPDVSREGGTTNPNEPLSPEAGENASTGEAGTSQGALGQASSTDEKATQDEGSFNTVQPADDMPAESDGTGSAAAGVQQGKAPSQGENKPVPNPLRSLGDALREIQQRFDEILNAETTDKPREQVGESNAQSQIEYLLPDEVDQEMQALGPAGEEQVAKLNQLTIIDEGIQAEEAPVAMDVDPVMPSEVKEATAEQIMQEHASNAMQLDEDIEGAFLRSAANNSIEHSSLHDLSGQKREENHGIDDDERTELQLREWRAADYPEDGGEKIWRLYESLTHDLAYNLCEQLRLILEPTMATRLKGDYRTGKRLNMKKVIPYIASDYTKDKIWLRRTKPSQREYQVLISIDDSRSMAESHSVHLAYQTLALISKALSRLESGDVAIAKFGETIDLLHGFDEGPFSDQAGTKVMNAFRFTQKATNVLSLLETSLKVLEKARERKSMSSASAADLWQLQIIISDGMCQDHEKLRTILRKAEEQRVMIVFIILDSLQTSSAEPGASSSGHHASILSMDKAEFKLVDGKMELQLQKYLDSFPFEYYVVLRQVEALPEVLAGTLKQFFERISEE